MRSASRSIASSRVVLCALLLFEVCGCNSRTALRAPDSLSAQIDSLVARELREQRIPGLALAVVRDGKLDEAKGYGLANVELKAVAQPGTVFQLGSIGKQFTATAVLLLAEDGRLALDDSIGKYFPEAPRAWQPITIRNLLNHASGIADYTDDKFIKPGGLIDFHAELTDDEILHKFAALPFEFKPGEKWQYCNTGYAILGFLIHRVSGQSYGDFLGARVFKPLGMNATRVISESDIVANRAAGYRLAGGEIKNQEWVSPHWNTLGDGALYSTAEDMAKWDIAISAGRILKAASYVQMWTPAPLANGKTYPYGFAWDLLAVNGHRLFEHGGAWQGFTAHYARYPDDHLSVIVLTNLDEEHADPGKIAYEVAAVYVPALKLSK